MPPGNWLNLSSSRACNMRVPILVEEEISSSVILRFSRSSFSFSPKDGKAVSRFSLDGKAEFYSVDKQDHRVFGRVLPRASSYELRASSKPGCGIAAVRGKAGTGSIETDGRKGKGGEHKVPPLRFAPVGGRVGLRGTGYRRSLPAGCNQTYNFVSNSGTGISWQRQRAHPQFA